MSLALRKLLAKALLIVGGGGLLVAFSAFHARGISDRTIREEVAFPPHLSTRFVLYPNHHIEGVDELGFKPGWVVVYAPRNKNFGTAFYVTLFGKMLVRGTPSFVTKQHLRAEEGIQNFQRWFAQLDAAVPLRSTYSNALTILGEPILTETNRDSSISAHFNYMPRDLSNIAIDWLTNGFVLVVSNNIVVQKGYSYTSSR